MRRNQNVITRNHYVCNKICIDKDNKLKAAETYCRKPTAHTLLGDENLRMAHEGLNRWYWNVRKSCFILIVATLSTLLAGRIGYCNTEPSENTLEPHIIIEATERKQQDLHSMVPIMLHRREDQPPSRGNFLSYIRIIVKGWIFVGIALRCKMWQLPYFWAGIKMYDVVAGRKVLVPSYILSKTRALELFPMLKKDQLVGAIVYYDGQHNDARMCLSIALTAARMGANIINHTEVFEVMKETDEQGGQRVCGAKVRDRFSNEEYEIRAKCVINATGPYTDSMRTMDDSETKKICAPASGVHIVLPDYYSPENMGLLDPATKDGRVIFFLPWEKSTIAGTTDRQCEVTDYPQPTEGEIEFILSEVKHYLSPDVQVRRGDVLSAWSGIRPLVRDPNKKDTQSIARNHIIEVSPNKLITIAGGKWTTYRSMAEETVDKAIDVCSLRPKKACQTLGLTLEGGHTWTPTMFIRLVQDYGLDTKVAKHLARTYGDKAVNVAKLAGLTGQTWPITGKLLHPSYPYIEAEIIYACKEYAYTVVDIIARRTRLAFLNASATAECLPRIIDLMAVELGWDKKRKQEELRHGRKFLQREMGLDLRVESQNVPINFSKDEINAYVARFKELDTNNKGYITVNDLRKYFEKNGESLTEDQLHEILNEVDLNRNGKVEMNEFLQLISARQSGSIGNTRFPFASSNDPIPVSRSGGGV